MEWCLNREKNLYECAYEGHYCAVDVTKSHLGHLWFVCKEGEAMPCAEGACPDMNLAKLECEKVVKGQRMALAGDGLPGERPRQLQAIPGKIKILSESNEEKSLSEELYESLINGNRSWVKEQILSLSTKDALKVILEMLEHGGSIKHELQKVFASNKIPRFKL